ncbi:MAG: leucyl aminopeptidase [Pseudomonadota bacterium]
MKLSFSAPKLPSSGALAVLMTSASEFPSWLKELDEASDGMIAKTVKMAKFKAKTGEIVEIIAPAASKLTRLLLVGVGDAKALTEYHFERAGGRIYARLATSGETTLRIAIDGVTGAKLPFDLMAKHLAVGVRLRSYRFDKYRTKEPKSKKPTLGRVAILTPDHLAAGKAFESYDKVLDGVFFTRDLVSEPANILYPASFAKRLKTLDELGVEVQVLGEKEMKKLGMGALLGVGQGSDRDSQLVIMKYMGADDPDEAPIAFIGKGVTFDTGGISIKPAPGMEQMKWDMGGAGAVSGAMMALAGRKAKANIVGVVGLVENMPSSTAQRPGDVVKTMSGQTVEVINTDAEGRLVLCDAMWYTQDRFKPKMMIDLATLTGAIIATFGNQFAGLFSNNDKLANQIHAAGEAVHERLWRLPVNDTYDKEINSQIADMKNLGGRTAGSITAAQFLQRFCNGLPWAHLDVAGTVWSEKDDALWEKGATGYGVRLIDRIVADNYET